MPWRGGLIVALGLTVSGCFLPAYQIVSWTATGVSYVFSGKGLGDHAISLAMNQDCATWRVFRGKKICVDYGRDFENSWEAMTSTWKVPAPGGTDNSVLVAGNPDDPVTDVPTRAAAPEVARNAETPPENASKGPAPVATDLKPAGGTVIEGLPVPQWAVARRDEASWVRAAFAQRDASLTTFVERDADAKTEEAPPDPVAGKVEPALYLVIGSFRSESNAKRLAERHSGISTAISKATSEHGTFYRLLAGPLEHASLAATRSRLGEAGFRNAWAVRLCHGSLTPPPCRPLVQEALLR